MFILSNFIFAFASVLNILFEVYWWLIIIRALVSWVNPDPYNVLVQFLYKSTEPVLAPLRRILPVGLRIGIDIAPILAIAAILFLKLFLVNSLFDLARYIR